MIGESDRYDAERAAEFASHKAGVLIPPSSPPPPRLGSSSVPFEGGLERLFQFIDQSGKRWYDKNWDGLHVAENAKSDGEAEIRHTNGRVRLVVATETTKEDCVALLMRPDTFGALYRCLRRYMKLDAADHKIEIRKNEASWASRNMRSEINDLRKELRKLKALESTDTATWRCKERLKDLHSRLKSSERLEAKLNKSHKKKLDLMARFRSHITEFLESPFAEANLLPRRENPSYSYTDSEPSPTIDRPYSHMYEEEPLRPTTKSSTKIFEGDIECPRQFPTLSNTNPHDSGETFGINAQASQSARKPERRGGPLAHLKNRKSSSSLSSLSSIAPSIYSEEDEGRKEQEEHDIDNDSDDDDDGDDDDRGGKSGYYDSHDKDDSWSWRIQMNLSRACGQSWRMYNLAVRRRHDAQGKREEVYRQQHDRRVRAGKEPETREAFDARWDKDHDRFVTSTYERLREDMFRAGEAGVGYMGFQFDFPDDGWVPKTIGDMRDPKS